MKGISILIISILAFFASNVLAQGARKHFLAGQDYYIQGRYEKAIEEFEEAYNLDPKPLLIFNIAQSHEKLGDLAKSVEYLKRYLQEDPKANAKSSLQNKIKVLESRIAATGITVKSNVDGAVIYIDDKSTGTTPVGGIVPLQVGTHKVRISKEGFGDFTMTVAISSGHSIPVKAVLEAKREEPELDKPVPEPQTDEAAMGQEKDRKIEALDIVPWAIAGVGAVATITGFAVLGSIAQSRDDHGMAVAADAIGWPGVALTVGGGIWGIIRLMKKKSSESETPLDEETAVLVVPFVSQTRMGAAVAVTF